jgi:hypothetical protein
MKPLFITVALYAAAFPVTTFSGTPSTIDLSVRRPSFPSAWATVSEE